jgi:type II secretory pathway pseudopilin PulG
MRNLVTSPRLRALRDRSGFTVAEVLAAAGILGVALAALLTAMGWGVTDVDAARRSTIALFLAEQRMEQIKAFALNTAPNRGWGNVDAAHFPAEAYGTMAGYGDYRRTVVVTPNALIPPGPAPSPFAKQIEVWVYYRPMKPSGLGPETAVSVSTVSVWR